MTLSLGRAVRRREFLTFIGGALIAKPLPAYAQSERMRRIGVLLPSGADDPEYEARMKAFTEHFLFSRGGTAR